jgi:hypothetical protein
MRERSRLPHVHRRLRDGHGPLKGLATAVAAACLIAAPAARALGTQQLSPGVATDAAISQDGRLARFAAYVDGRGEHRQVKLVRRAKPYGTTGTAWKAGGTSIASARNGHAGNDDSFGPVFSGYDDVHGVHAAKCMAFVSKASNLVSGDRNGHKANVFVRNLSSGKLTLIEGSGGATEVAIDGVCENVAFAAGGTIFKAGTDGHGHQRVSSPGGSASPNLSASGKVVTFERNGVIYSREGSRTRRIATGTQPDADDFSKVVAFVNDGLINQASLSGTPNPHVLDQRSGGNARGAQPSESAGGGGFVFYVSGPLVRVNALTPPMGDCGRANAEAPMTSGHGNYVVYTCDGGGAFLTYVGPQ